MSYMERVLQPGETMLATSRLHWCVYLPAIFYILAAIAVWSFVPAGQSPLGHLVPVGSSLLLALGLLFALGAWLRRLSTEVAVTDHRVLFKTGILVQRTIEMNRSKVESVDVEQSLTGRLFGYGTVVVHGTGGSLEPFRNIADPLAFRSRITL